MAARFWVTGGVNNNWSTTGNWSTTSGGGGGSAVPTASDDVTFDSAGNSACNTLNAARVCKTLTVASGYTSTLTITSGGTISVSGNITLNTGFTFVNDNAGDASKGLKMIVAATMTSNGKTVSGPFTIEGFTSGTVTLADALAVSGNLTLNNATSITFSGAFDITADTATISNGEIITLSGNVTIAGTTTIQNATDQIDGAFNWNTLGLTIASGVTLQGSATLVFNGTGTWAANDTAMTMNINIAAGGGTLTISGTHTYKTGTITYTSGTVDASGSTLNLTAATTLNTAGMNWASVNLLTSSTPVTITINSLLTATGTLTLPANANATFAGTAGWTVGTFTNGAGYNNKTTTFGAGLTYTITAQFTMIGTSTTVHNFFVSSTPGTLVNFVLGASAGQDVGFVDPTDMDDTTGVTIFTYKGVIVTSSNWTASVPSGGVGGGVRAFGYAG